jgi:hypothetical protein
MKPEKLAHQIEKIIEKLAAMSYRFSTDELQGEFNCNKEDSIELLNGMLDALEHEELLDEHADE